MCLCVFVCVWQGRAEWGVGMVQSSTPSRLFIFPKHSTTQPGTVFLFSDWDMQGHKKLHRDHWTVAGSHVTPAERGCPLRQQGAHDDNLVLALGWIFESEENHTKVFMFSAQTEETKGSKHPPQFPRRLRALNGSMTYQVTKWSSKSADELTWRKRLANERSRLGVD